MICIIIIIIIGLRSVSASEDVIGDPCIVCCSRLVVLLVCPANCKQCSLVSGQAVCGASQCNTGYVNAGNGCARMTPLLCLALNVHFN